MAAAIEAELGELCTVVKRVGVDEGILQLDYWKGGDGNGEGNEIDIRKVDDNEEIGKGKNFPQSYRSDLTFFYL